MKKKTTKKKVTKKKTTKRNSGTPRFIPTPQHRMAVVAMRKDGIGMHEMCKVMGVSTTVMNKYFRKEMGPMVKGTKRFRPTKEDRNKVKALIGFGMTHKQVASLVINPRTEKPICKQTLEDEFPEELAAGVNTANAKILESLYKKATGDGKSAVAACIWWTKVRLGWRGDALELTGSGGGPVEFAPTDGPKERLRSLVTTHREAALIAAGATELPDLGGAGENGDSLPDHD